MSRNANRLTDQQSKAVDQRSVSVVLSSGAGCGKTHVLTERYLSHLKFDGVEVSEIVAITFTDRAAREMRGRIRNAITTELQSATEESASRWAEHLRNLETAPISTIHSFCGNLLRQHSVIAGLDPNFEVLEEVLATTLRHESIHSTLEQLLTSPSELGNDLRELVVLYGWGNTIAALEQLIQETDEASWKSWLLRDNESIAKAWREEKRSELLNHWVPYLLAASPAIARCLHLLQATPCLGVETKSNVAQILQKTPQLASSTHLAQAIEELSEYAKVGKERAKAWKDEVTYESIKNAFADFRGELTKRFRLFTEEPESLELEIQTSKRFLRIALELVHNYQDRKRRVGVLDFQDLLVLARNLVRDHPQVLENLSQRFHYLLLDELQDTDPVQMELVELLCGVGLHHGKLFAVGDHKQSIYRFRGADVALFQKLKRDIPQHGQLDLTKNFRSQPPLLDFVNILCSLRIPDYEPLQAHHPRMNSFPCIEFLWSIPNEEVKERTTESRKREAYSIAERISELLISQEPRIYDSQSNQLRPAKAGDIVLLFRSMSNVAIYEAALRRAGLDYYLVGGRAFFAQQEIYDLLSLLRTLENPDDSLSLTGTLRSPFCGLSDEALFLLGSNRQGIWVNLQNDDRIQILPEDQRPIALRARKFLNRWREGKDRLPIASLINTILTDSGYDAAMQFEFLGDRKLANLWKLIDLARSFDQSGLFGLSDFIDRLGDMVLNQPREEQAATQAENADVIKLMSIHQAKGLEFPIVILPDFAATTRGDHLSLARWHSEYGCIVRPPREDNPPLFSDFGWQLAQTADTIADWEEDLRVLYVACTRARDLLILSAGLSGSFPPNTSSKVPISIKNPNAWMMALGERFHLQTGECLATDVLSESMPKVHVRCILPEVSTEKTSGSKPPKDFSALPQPHRIIDSQSLQWWPRIVSIPALERIVRSSLLQRKQSDLFSSSASRFDFEAQLSMTFISEDLLEWNRHRTIRDRLVAFDDSIWGRKERLLRFVLERWDWFDIDGWQSILMNDLSEEDLASITPAVSKDIGQMCRILAESSILEEWSESSTLLRDVEYLIAGSKAIESVDVPLSMKGHPIPDLHGICDVAWQDSKGEWHLLAIDQGGKDYASDKWLGRKNSLILQAFAMREHLGKAIRTIRQLDLSDGHLEVADARRIKYSQGFRWVFGTLEAVYGK